MAEYGAGVDTKTTAAVTLAAGPTPDRPQIYLADGRIDAALLPEDEASQTPRIEAYFAEALDSGKASALIKAEGAIAHRHIGRIVRLASQAGLNVHVAVKEAR